MTVPRVSRSRWWGLVLSDLSPEIVSCSSLVNVGYPDWFAVYILRHWGECRTRGICNLDQLALGQSWLEEESRKMNWMDTGVDVQVVCFNDTLVTLQRCLLTLLLRAGDSVLIQARTADPSKENRGFLRDPKGCFRHPYTCQELCREMLLETKPYPIAPVIIG